MKKITPKNVDWLLNLHEPSPKQSDSTTSIKKWIGKGLLWLLGIVTLVLLPFLLLVRTSVFMNVSYQWNGWLALAAGMIAAVGLLVVYILLLFRQVRNKQVLLRYALAGCAVMVFSFCLYAAFYFSAVHAKNEEVHRVYRSMHPVLRVAIATATLADTSLIITDIERTPGDYTHMGLPVNNRSLHYVQSTGYVHAVDIRTVQRNEFRNAALALTFRLMGFHTLRHVGTADHLHVSLPV